MDLKGAGGVNLRKRQAVIRELGVRYRAAGKREKGGF